MSHNETIARFPEVPAPPIPTRIPQSANEARAMYAHFQMMLGVVASGEILGIDLTRISNALVVGGTGSGKSVLMRTVIESFRTAGWMIFIGDGKGSDYQGLHHQPGICAISRRAADHVRLVRMIADELRARQSDAIVRNASGEADTFHRPPLVLVLDEYANLLAAVDSAYGRESFEDDLRFVARVGREFKVHLIMSTQEAHARTLNVGLLGHMGLRVLLGPADGMTFSDVVPESLREEVRSIGVTIGKKDRGRGIAVLCDDEDNHSAIEFQSFYGYSPATSKTSPERLSGADWSRYKCEASDKIPSLYPRFWFKVTGPDYAKSLADLYALPMVALDHAPGTPDPDMARYDPLHPSYLGADETQLAPLMFAFGES